MTILEFPVFLLLFRKAAKSVEFSPPRWFSGKGLSAA
jgi:hypothetical protein